MSALPPEPVTAPTVIGFKPRRVRRDRDTDAERVTAERLIQQIGTHRQVGRAALLAGDMDAAFDELWAARALEPDLDRLGAAARASMPADWELETDLTPLARALSARHHPRASDAWRHVLEERPARSIQAEAADWLAQDAAVHENWYSALRFMHIANSLGRANDPEKFHALYRQAGIDPTSAFALYLAASRAEPRAARAAGLKDPLTGALWSDQDARWWTVAGARPTLHVVDHQAEAVRRGRDLAITTRDEGWVLLAEGDFAAGPLGVRPIGRNVRSGVSEPADEELFLHIRTAYEGSAERLPDVAWPWYRLAELLAWAGFPDVARTHLAQGERRGLGDRTTERASRATLRTLVEIGLGSGPDGLPTTTRPFPPQPYAARLGWRWRFWPPRSTHV
ncbi:MAG: hypothetical protein NVSMB2_04940 [Chloroflexota bacterium]